jgi:glycosyltransferase involved in cell wall biosynthesis
MAAGSAITTIQPIPYFPVVASLPEWATTSEREQESLRILHAPMFYFPRILKSLDGFWLYRAILKSLMTLQQAGQIDVVDAHFGYPEGVGALIAAKKIGIPCVVTLRGFEVEYIHKPLIGRQIKHLIRHADGCICVGHFLRELALENGADAKRTCVIHNAIDEQLFFPADRIEARRTLGIDADVPIVISVGHLILRKRHHVLVSAFAELLEKQSDARLLIIGDKNFQSGYARRLQEQVSQLGIAGSVEFLGNIDASQIGDYLRAANVFALATQREGCCNAVLEALACGLPVVTTPVGDNTWFVKDGINGYIVPVDDSEAMASALSKATHKDDWDGERISANLGVGDWDRVATEVTEFFGKILESY